MERVAVLTELDRRMLEAFSRRTTEKLRSALPRPLRIVLPRLEPFLAANVAKEVRKDALTIRRAGEALAVGERPGPGAVDQLFESTQEIDRDFLRTIDRFPVRVRIPYDRIAPLRLQRIERVLDLAYRILREWQAGSRLRDAFGKEELEQSLLQILELYVQESLALSHSVSLPALLEPVRERLVRRLHGVMNEVITRLASEIATAVCRRDRN
jgi:hypothetical protein